jgi:hypothetical protein
MDFYLVFVHLNHIDDILLMFDDVDDNNYDELEEDLMNLTEFYFDN